MVRRADFRRLFTTRMPLPRRMGLAVGLLIQLVVFVIRLVTRPPLNSAFSTLAARYRGKFVAGHWGSAPSTSFHFHATHVTVTTDVSSLDGRSPVTVVHLDWLDPGLQCDIVANIAPRPGVLSSVPQRCVVRVSSNDESIQRSFHALSGQLGKLAASFDLTHLTIERGIMRIAVMQTLRHARRLDEFVSLSLGLYCQALLAAEPGIKIVAHAEPPACGEIICNVCGEAMVADIVYCQRCQTPHHRECWKYNGECSIYGCGASKYARSLPSESDLSEF